MKRLPGAVVNGRPARLYRLGLDSWIGVALPHIDVAYDEQTRELLRFIGIANIRSSRGRNVQAKIVFDPAQDTVVGRDAVTAAEILPPDGGCSIP